MVMIGINDKVIKEIKEYLILLFKMIGFDEVDIILDIKLYKYWWEFCFILNICIDKFVNKFENLVVKKVNILFINIIW